MFLNDQIGRLFILYTFWWKQKIVEVAHRYQEVNSDFFLSIMQLKIFIIEIIVLK